MNCPQCNQHVSSEDQFCGYCGANLSDVIFQVTSAQIKKGVFWTVIATVIVVVALVPSTLGPILMLIITGIKYYIDKRNKIDFWNRVKISFFIMTGWIVLKFFFIVLDIVFTYLL